MSKFIDKIKYNTKEFFRGEEGSIFWLIQWTIQMIKETIAAINERLRMSALERNMKKNNNLPNDEN